jgi:hypothetical protein
MFDGQVTVEDVSMALEHVATDNRGRAATPDAVNGRRTRATSVRRGVKE